MDIRKHFAHQVIQNGEMRRVKVPTSAQVEDMLTKVVSMSAMLVVFGRCSPLLTKGLHLPQSSMCVERILGRRRTSTL
jgi:hypothetical protein